MPTEIDARAWSAPARAVAATLRALAALNLVYLGAHLLQDIFTGTKSAPPQPVLLGMVIFSAVPWIASFGLGRLAAATIAIEPARVVVTTRAARLEIPIASIQSLHPWSIPLPEAGIAIRMTSGRRFRLGIAAANLDALIAALTPALPAAGDLAFHPAVAWARARRPRRWSFWAGKYGLFPLALAVLVFRLHQMIVYGGAFGEAYQHGYAAYFKSFAFFWAWNAAQLVIYAGTLRVVAEALLLAITWALPARAGGARRAIEILTLVAYFGLIPAYVAARLLA